MNFGSQLTLSQIQKVQDYETQNALNLLREQLKELQKQVIELRAEIKELKK